MWREDHRKAWGTERTLCMLGQLQGELHQHSPGKPQTAVLVSPSSGVKGDRPNHFSSQTGTFSFQLVIRAKRICTNKGYTKCAFHNVSASDLARPQNTLPNLFWHPLTSSTFLCCTL
uniref:Uncharacterized protein n=1 Tax=Ornithodoros turicata TaxID=34597 RepID=A0A2R5LG98_9ACAR